MRLAEKRRAYDEAKLHGAGERTQVRGDDSPRALEVVRGGVGAEPERCAEEFGDHDDRDRQTRRSV
jgi:hypothetical protein